MDNKFELTDSELENVTGGVTPESMVNYVIGAVNENWSFSLGGASAGAVDASGLIYSLVGGYRTSQDMFNNASESGPIYSMPETPGLGLYDGQYLVGVYIGNGECVCALNESSGVIRTSLSSIPWVYWFKIYDVEY